MSDLNEIHFDSEMLTAAVCHGVIAATTGLIAPPSFLLHSSVVFDNSNLQITVQWGKPLFFSAFHR